jgi:hypothetical protein
VFAAALGDNQRPASDSREGFCHREQKSDCQRQCGAFMLLLVRDKARGMQTLCLPFVPLLLPRSRHHPSGSPPVAAAATPVPSMPVLPAHSWQLGAVESDTGLDGPGSSSGTAAAAADEDVPPLDLALLCGRAIIPANVALLLQEGEQRR